MLSKQFNTQEKLILFQLIADLNADGLPIMEILKSVRAKGEGIYKASFIQKTTDILERMADSSSISDAFRGAVSEDEIAVIKSAEVAGDFTKGFSSLVKAIQVKKQISGSLKSALTMPAILILSCLLVIMMYSIKVFPSFELAMPVEKWPGISQNVYGFGKWLYQGGLLEIFAIIAAIVFLLSLSLNRIKGPFRDKILDKIQPYSTYKRISSSSFLLRLSILVRSGTPIVDAIKMLRQYSSGWTMGHIDKIIDRLNAGSEYQEAFNTGYFSGEDLFLISLYTSTGNFFDVLEQIADKSSEITINSISITGKLLNTFALLGFAVIVLTIFGATFSLSSAFADMAG